MFQSESTHRQACNRTFNCHPCHGSPDVIVSVLIGMGRKISNLFSPHLPTSTLVSQFHRDLGSDAEIQKPTCLNIATIVPIRQQWFEDGQLVRGHRNDVEPVGTFVTEEV